MRGPGSDGDTEPYNDRAVRRALTAPLLLALLVLLPGAPTGAQEERPVTVELNLLSQTSLATPSLPFRFEVIAHHVSGPPLRDLTVTLWVYNPATSRSAYHQGLEAEPPTAPLLVVPVGNPGPLEPGGELRIEGQRRLSELTARGGNALYPIKVQLESGGVAVTSVRSALVFIGEKPLVPLNVSLVFMLDPEIRSTPDGTLADDTLEEAIQPGGRLDGVISALEEGPPRSTLVISPQLVEWLRRMADGYRVAAPDGTRHVGAGTEGAQRAGETLERIRAVARSAAVEVVALPYASPSIPSLVASGLEADLQIQIQEGRETVEEILGVSVPTTILRPPAASLDRASARVLGELGVETVILDAGSVPPPIPVDSILSPLATARLRTGMTAIVPDGDVSSYLAQTDVEPPLRATRLVGELASLYLEQPSVLRGAAVVFRDTQSPPELLAPLVRMLADPPPEAAWLRPVKATQLAEAVPATIGARLRGSQPPVFSPAFVEELRVTRQAIGQFEAMAEGTVPLPERLRRLLLSAEAEHFATDQGAALAFIRSVRESLAREFRKIESPSGTSVTLTSRGGVIPVTLRSIATYPVRIRVTLRSPRLDFLEGRSREVVLDEEARSLTFPVRAQTTGRFPVRILVDTPGGRRISESRIVVRSTAYNRVALLVTIGAAAFLALWWGRRLLRRTMS